MKLLARGHRILVLNRRIRILGALLTPLLPAEGSVLDVGCGNGAIARLLREQRSGLRVTGIDVIARPGAAIQVQVFDGRHIPYDDRSFDTVMFVDVLHHTRNSDELLQEARRVARRAIIIKDHLCAGRLDAVTLRVMDWVGNRPHGVTLTYDYLSAEEWRAMFRRHRLRVAYWAGEIGLYPWPASLFFVRSLHFIAKLVPH